MCARAQPRGPLFEGHLISYLGTKDNAKVKQIQRNTEHMETGPNHFTYHSATVTCFFSLLVSFTACAINTENLYFNSNLESNFVLLTWVLKDK